MALEAIYKFIVAYYVESVAFPLEPNLDVQKYYVISLSKIWAVPALLSVYPVRAVAHPVAEFITYKKLVSRLFVVTEVTSKLYSLLRNFWLSEEQKSLL